MKRQLQKDLEIIGKKVDTIRTEIKSIMEKIDKVEERMIFGNLSNSRGEELSEILKDQLSEKERRLFELTNETAYKQQQMMEADFMGDLKEATMTLDDKIDIVKKVIKKVNVVRLSKYTAHITIYNRINDIVTVYELKSNIRSKDRGWRKKEEYHLKEKKTS